MNKRVLGRSGIKVSEISLGGVEIGIPYGIGIKSQADMLNQAEAIKLLRAAVDGGINFFDTARLYGKSEEIMGKAFKNIRGGVIICTKCTYLQRHNEQLSAKKTIKEIIDNSLEESLEALQTDYIDIYMIHNASLEILDNQEIAETFS